MVDKDSVNPSHAGYTAFQQGARRLEVAMRAIPDRVPVFAQMHEFVRNELDIPARAFYTTPELLAAGTLEIMEKYNIEVPALDYDTYNIEAEALGQYVIYSDEQMPDVDRTRPLIQDRADLKKVHTPDFDAAGRFPHVIEANSLFRKLTGGVDSTLRFCAPFSLAANIRGIERLLMDICTDPDFARSLLDRLTEEVVIPWILRLKQEFPGAKSILGADASASLPIVNLPILQHWVIPYVLRLRQVCGPEVYVPNWMGEHFLKNPEKMFDFKVQVCPEFLEGQDPDVEKLGPACYKEYATTRGVSLVLGIGARFLAQSTPFEVTERVRHYIEAGGANGRFALLLCNLGATTPPENVRVAIEAVHQYGTYAT